MATYDLGDQVALAVEILDADGDLANAGAVALTLTLPDGTTTTPLVSNPSTGKYEATYTPTLPGRHGVNWVATGANASAYNDVFNVADPTMARVVSLAEAKDYLNITTTSSDEELRRLIEVISRVGEQYTGRVFGRRTVTDRLSGGFAQLALHSVPVIEVTQVKENGAVVPASGWVLSSGTGGVLTRLNGTLFRAWHPGAYNIEVTYTAGYSNQPAPDRHGCLEFLRHLWTTQRGSIAMMPRDVDEWNPSQAFSIPRRVQELWDLNLMGQV